MQSLSINTGKIDKTALYEGRNGKYLNLTLFENRDGPDQYGNDGFIVQDIGKDRRDRGEKGPIIGNWKHIGKKPAPVNRNIPSNRSGYQNNCPPPRDNSAVDADTDDSDIPFRQPNILWP